MPFGAGVEGGEGAIPYINAGMAGASGLQWCHSLIRSLINCPGMFHGVNCPLGRTTFPSAFFLHFPFAI
jgi:hypothetical protein